MIPRIRTFPFSRTLCAVNCNPVALLAVLLLPLAGAAASVEAITAEEMRQAQEAGELGLIIDIRSPAEFERGHIAGAINIPHFALDTRSIPPAGAVAVYGDGLGRLDEAAAGEAVGEKPGVQAWLLAGGLSAWESAGFPTTHPKGLADADVPVITYEQLTEIRSAEIVLGDLRSREPKIAASGGNAAPPPLTDLRKAFPSARVIDQDAAAASNPRSAPISREVAMMRELGRTDANRELIVLIDDGDGSAEKTALKLRSAGNRRVVILAGGETILTREGRPGLQRLGYGFAESEPENPDQHQEQK